MATLLSTNRMMRSSPRPLRTLNIGNAHPVSKSASMKRKSAVELLEESKAFYVKSERVLDAKQELPHSEHFRIRSPPLLPPKSHEPMSIGHVIVKSPISAQKRERVDLIARESKPREQISLPRGTGTTAKDERHSSFTVPHSEQDIPLLCAAGSVPVARVRRISSMEQRAKPLLVSTSSDANSRTNQWFLSSGPTSLDPALLSLDQSQPPELPNRFNRHLLTPPPVPPKSPGLRLKQQEVGVAFPPSSPLLSHSEATPTFQKTKPVFSKGTPVSPKATPASPKVTPTSFNIPPAPSEVTPISLEITPTPEVSYRTTARLNLARSLFLHKSLPELNPDVKEESGSDSASSGICLINSASNGSSSGSKVASHRRSRSTAGERGTSDYASRSPSFKYEKCSNSHSATRWHEDQHTQTSPLRHSSDRNLPEELEYFFDSFGQSFAPSQCSGDSSPVYFSSVSSVDSMQRKTFSDEDIEDLIHGRPTGISEPSIVERNARIIKWLIGCRKALSNVNFISGNRQANLSTYGQSTRL